MFLLTQPRPDLDPSVPQGRLSLTTRHRNFRTSEVHLATDRLSYPQNDREGTRWCSKCVGVVHSGPLNEVSNNDKARFAWLQAPVFFLATEGCPTSRRHVTCSQTVIELSFQGVMQGRLRGVYFDDRKSVDSATTT